MRDRREEGFTLVALVVAIFLILLVLGVAAPKVAKDLKRDLWRSEHIVMEDPWQLRPMNEII